MSKKSLLKNDKYRKSRGGHSRLLSINCATCGYSLFRYQKDGAGSLKRIYLDRIASNRTMSVVKKLTCKNCGHVLGTYYLYPKEKRPAYRLYQDAILKKIVKNT